MTPKEKDKILFLLLEKHFNRHFIFVIIYFFLELHDISLHI